MDGEASTTASETADKFPPFIKVKWESGQEDIHYFLLQDGIPEDLRLRYENELNETPEKREKGLLRLKEIIRREKLENLSDTLLIGILRSSKFNFKKAEAKLRNFIVHRRKFVKKLALMDLDVVKKVCDDKPTGLLPYRDRHGRVVIYCRPAAVQYDNFSVDDATTVGIAMLLFNLSTELTTTAGLAFLGDIKDLSTTLYLPILNEVRKFRSTVLSYPMRIGRIDFLNEYPAFLWLYNVLRRLAPEKIANRCRFNGPYENFIKTYHPDALPAEFGGNLGPLSNDFLKLQFLDFIADLREEAKSMSK